MRKKLGEILLASGAVNPTDIDSALSDQSAGEPSRLGDLLVQLGRITPEQLARALSTQYGLPWVRLPVIPAGLLAEIPEEFQRQHRLVPFKLEGPVLHVAVADPPNAEALSQLVLSPGRRISVSVAAGDEIDAIHAASNTDFVLPAARASPSAGALSADDLFSDLKFDTTSGIRQAPPLARGAGGAPAPRNPDLEEELFGPGTGKVGPRQPPAEPRALDESTFRPGGDAALSTPSEASFATDAAQTSPSGLRELRGHPTEAGGAVTHTLPMPDWLQVDASGVPASSPSGIGLPPVPAALQVGPRGEWTGALDATAPSRLVIALVKALLAKGLISERELLELLERK